MRQLNEELEEHFIESMVDKIIKKLSAKFDLLDISLDFIAAALMSGGRSPVDIGRGQKFGSRAPKQRPIEKQPPE